MFPQLLIIEKTEKKKGENMMMTIITVTIKCQFCIGIAFFVFNYLVKYSLKHDKKKEKNWFIKLSNNALSITSSLSLIIKKKKH